MNTVSKQHNQSVELALHRLVSASLSFALAEHTAQVNISPSNGIVSIFVNDGNDKSCVIETILLGSKGAAEKINAVTDQLNELNNPLPVAS